MLDVALNLLEKVLGDGWRRPLGGVLLSGTAIVVAALAQTAAEYDLLVVLMLDGAAGVAAASVWALARRPPKAKRRRIGFAFGIDCRDQSQRHLIEDDLIRPLKAKLREGAASRSFQLFDVPAYFLRPVSSSKSLHELRELTRARFMFVVRAKKRKSAGRIVHGLEVHGAVATDPIPADIQRRYSQEFADLIPKEVVIPEDEEFLQFQVQAESTHVAVEYIVGVAFALSGDPVRGLELYESALASSARARADNPMATRISKLVPERIAEACEAIANSRYKDWKRTRDQQLLTELSGLLVRAQKASPGRTRILSLLALCTFVDSRDTLNALSVLKRVKARDRKSHVHLLNEAFLHGYSGDLAKCVRSYRKVAKEAQGELELDVINEIEAFQAWILESEPANAEIRFMLGAYNMIVKGDTKSALRDLRAFLSDTEEESGPRLREREAASKWIDEMNQAVEAANDSHA